MTSVLRALSAAVGLTGAPAHEAALQKELRIKSLHIHPIKSCAGSSVQTAKIQRAGLAFDRTWLIIDAATRVFCTARGSPHMVRIRPVLDHEAGLLRIYVPNSAGEPGSGETEVTVPLTPSDEELRQCELVEGVQIWGFMADGYAVSKEADEALSAFMGKPVRLVRKGPKHRPGGGDDPRGAESETAFQDFHSLTVVSAESLAQVQETLLASVYPEHDSAKALEAYPVSERIDRDFWTPDRLRSLAIERFRINIVLQTLPSSSRPALQAWEEDCFTHLEVFPADAADDVDFGAEVKGQGVGIDVNARCARCLVPTVDPETGKRDNAQMPYSLLQKYRQVQPEMKKIGKPCFGMLSSPSQESGELHVGDVVRVTATRDPATRPLSK